MTIKIQASIETALDKWSEEQAETNNLHQGEVYWPDTLIQRMAEAAYAVLMANYEGQKFAKEQDGE